MSSAAQAGNPLLAALEAASHALPDQGPIRVFIHHNTLHAYEHLPFHDAVTLAAEELGGEPYMSEDAYRDAFTTGRIEAVDLARSIKTYGPPAAPGLDDWRAFVHAALFIPQHFDDVAVSFLVSEGELLRTARDRRLWARACALAEGFCWAKRTVRVDRATTAPDARVHAVLIPLAAAYLDTGLSAFPLPFEGSFYEATRDAIAESTPPSTWLKRARAAFIDQRARGSTALDVVREATAPLRSSREVEAYLRERLLALPGWAGIFRRLEREPRRPRPATLLDFVAARLVLDRASMHADELDAKLHVPAAPRGPESARYVLFQLLRERAIADTAEGAHAALRAFEGLTDAARRKIWHEAYEGCYRRRVLSAMHAHAKHATARSKEPPEVQVICCIDDREESLRRHLEELEPTWETFGTAGFFGLAIELVAAHDPTPAVLCPANVAPSHRLEEWGGAQHEGVGRRLRDAFMRSVAVLAPRVIARRSAAEVRAPMPPMPALRVSGKKREGLPVGFAVDEAADRIAQVLTDIGVRDGLAPLVFVLGHGSTSRNNPQESAHDCGACGGHHGTANARAFAALANDPRVREALAQRGIEIPRATRFIGGHHDTANDDILLLDLADVPPSPALDRAKATFLRARALDAHERCRRFASVPLDATPAKALRHVQERAEDLAQPRPEYGHCTNAFAVVGRRALTRGLFLDRRAFLISYDPSIDATGEILARISAGAVPVGAGISLEYYFSFNDNTRYGAGTKLPHNVTSLLGVMDGPRSDLRTGLPWQMVDIHEPMRLLIILEATHEHVVAAAAASPAVGQLVNNAWVQLATISPSDGAMHVLEGGAFVPFSPDERPLTEARSSTAYYRGRRDHLGPARIASPRVSP